MAREQTLRCEVAWAAGFFDGEGSVYISPRTIRGRVYKQLNLRVGQSGYTCPHVLDRFQKAVKAGAVYGPEMPHNRTARLPIWTFRTSNLNDALKVIGTLLPFLSEVKTADCLAAIEEMWDYQEEVASRVVRSRAELKKLGV